jgi:hypothetical protein
VIFHLINTARRQSASFTLHRLEKPASFNTQISSIDTETSSVGEPNSFYAAPGKYFEKKIFWNFKKPTYVVASILESEPEPGDEEASRCGSDSATPEKTDKVASSDHRYCRNMSLCFSTWFTLFAHLKNVLGLTKGLKMSHLRSAKVLTLSESSRTSWMTQKEA